MLPEEEPALVADAQETVRATSSKDIATGRERGSPLGGVSPEPPPRQPDDRRSGPDNVRRQLSAASSGDRSQPQGPVKVEITVMERQQPYNGIDSHARETDGLPRSRDDDSARTLPWPQEQSREKSSPASEMVHRPYERVALNPTGNLGHVLSPGASHRVPVQITSSSRAGDSRSNRGITPTPVSVTTATASTHTARNSSIIAREEQRLRRAELAADPMVGMCARPQPGRDSMHEAKTHELFDRIDRNHDGMITRQEWAQAITEEATRGSATVPNSGVTLASTMPNSGSPLRNGGSSVTVSSPSGPPPTGAGDGEIVVEQRRRVKATVVRGASPTWGMGDSESTTSVRVHAVNERLPTSPSGMHRMMSDGALIRGAGNGSMSPTVTARQEVCVVASSATRRNISIETAGPAGGSLSPGAPPYDHPASLTPPPPQYYAASTLQGGQGMYQGGSGGTFVGHNAQHPGHSGDAVSPGGGAPRLPPRRQRAPA